MVEVITIVVSLCARKEGSNRDTPPALNLLLVTAEDLPKER